MYFTRLRKKRNLKILYRRREGGKEGLCIFSPLMVISLAECTFEKRDLERESFNLKSCGGGGGILVTQCTI